MSTARLDRLLANLGYGSRREIQALAKAGKIEVSGVPLTDASARISLIPPPDITIAGQPLDPLPGMVLMLNKPCGTTCSHKESGPLVHDLLPPRWRRREPPVSTIGRLDKETSGLLLMTDDGGFLHRVISPKNHVPKRYIATLARPLSGDETRVFASGTLMLEGEEKPLLPAKLRILDPVTAQITITEGRYHQVRRMFAAVGNHVQTLERQAIGSLELPPGLAPGAWRLLSEAERAAIFA